MTYWWDEKKNDHNIIQCGKNKILISQYKAKTNYSITTDEKHPYNLGGMVYKHKDKDYLITSATYGLIKVIDLELKKEIHSIVLEDVFFYSFVKWNEQYILLNDCLQRRILILDMDDDYKIKKQNEIKFKDKIAGTRIYLASPLIKINENKMLSYGANNLYIFDLDSLELDTIIQFEKPITKLLIRPTGNLFLFTEIKIKIIFISNVIKGQDAKAKLSLIKLID